MDELVYDDPWTEVVVPAEPAAAGHIRVRSKLDATTLEGLEDDQIEHLFFVASYAGTAIFELLGVQGTNMLLTEGEGPLVIDILARRQDDDLDLQWSPTDPDQSRLQSTAKSIRDEIDVMLWKEQNPQAETSSQPVEETPIKEGEENYLLKHLRRHP